MPLNDTPYDFMDKSDLAGIYRKGDTQRRRLKHFGELA